MLRWSGPPLLPLLKVFIVLFRPLNAQYATKYLLIAVVMVAAMGHKLHNAPPTFGWLGHTFYDHLLTTRTTTTQPLRPQLQSSGYASEDKIRRIRRVLFEQKKKTFSNEVTGNVALHIFLFYYALVAAAVLFLLLSKKINWTHTLSVGRYSVSH